MKRTTIMLPDETAARVAREARRRGVSVAAVVREAVEEHLPAEQPRKLSFIGIVEGSVDDATRVDEVVRDAILQKHRDGTL
ncbi:MAG: ribbon-helix-helix domain-containing protein [Gaiella sp.]|nr:ribbon-helix-helix domain-containing protein [Gaiella sp.]